MLVGVLISLLVGLLVMSARKVGCRVVHKVAGRGAS